MVLFPLERPSASGTIRSREFKINSDREDFPFHSCGYGGRAVASEVVCSSSENGAAVLWSSSSSRYRAWFFSSDSSADEYFCIGAPSQNSTRAFSFDGGFTFNCRPYFCQYEGVYRDGIEKCHDMETCSSITWNLQFFAEERTEPASPRKRRREREEGRVAKSQDLGASIVIIVGLLGLSLLGGFFWQELVTYLQNTIALMGQTELGKAGWQHSLWINGLRMLVFVWLPLGGAAALAALGVTVAQVGFVITSKPLVPKPDRFNLVSGLKKIISLRSLVELFKGLIKAALFCIVIYSALRKEVKELVGALQLPLEGGLALVFHKIWKLSMKLAFLLLSIALFDYLYQKWEFERSIRMSRQEIKEEYKQMEGDPMLRSKIRQKQRELARSRMMASVPDADVVITNPTTLAIALEYDKNLMEAPVVVAMGKGFIAQRIREIAEEHKVPIVENKPLAWALYDSSDIGDEIPHALYKAVAEVLAFVYKLKKKDAYGH